MPQACTVCSHEERFKIEDAIWSGGVKRRIAAQYGLSESAVRNHIKEGHFDELIRLAREGERLAKAEAILDRIEFLHEKSIEIFEEVWGKKKARDALFAISQARENLKLIAEVRKFVGPGDTYNFYNAPQYIELRGVILRVLEPYPEIRSELAEALRELGGDGS